MNVIDLILRKRDGGALSQLEIAGLVHGYAAGAVPDYQMSAFLMAAFLKGMKDGELVALTEAMLQSGVILDLSDISGVKVDKHSTGGVGDKVSVALAPIVAACGVPVPMISGRGLGHTGGTLDKLESIPGFRTRLSMKDYRKQLAEIGIVMIGQTDEIAPADRKLYALRDVTGTVEFIPFIAASILSKKLAEGIDALVLDVKSGSGALMQAESDARRLAQTLVRLAGLFGVRSVALLTDMDQPLGRTVGNWPEILEAVQVLKGEGPRDVSEVTIALAAEMLVAGNACSKLDEGRRLAQQSVDSGAALEKFIELVDRQGGSTSAITGMNRNEGPVPVRMVRAPDGASGYVAAMNARTIGRAGIEIGAGRIKKEDDVDPTAGFTLHVKRGEAVQPGDPLVTMHGRDTSRFDAGARLILSAFSWSKTLPEVRPLLMDRYANGAWLNP